MSNVPYIDYLSLNEFYTIKETIALFQITKDELQQACEQYDTQPRRNEIGEWGFVKYDVRKLHNKIYHANKTSPGKDDSPWQ